jgi:hypothetical protein
MIDLAPTGASVLSKAIPEEEPESEIVPGPMASVRCR